MLGSNAYGVQQGNVPRDTNCHMEDAPSSINLSWALGGLVVVVEGGGIDVKVSQTPSP
jgi:hypothetical protein